MLLWLADLVLLLHVTFVAFVLLGLLLVILGRGVGWRWIYNPWFRYIHLGAIGFVIVQTWLGLLCPLTVLEMTLREKAGSETYAGSFMGYWLQRLLYYDAPWQVFALAYSLFGLLVCLSLWWIRPGPLTRRSRNATMKKPPKKGDEP